jgi:SAM-dependent methyltransferase
LIADLYDYITPYSLRPDLDFYVDAALAAAGPVLEAGCGTGRVLLPAARAGVHITGLDLSPHMLAICRQRLAAEPEDVQSRVRLVEGDMRTFELPGRFALVTIPFRPFQHLTTVEDQLAALANIRRHLAPDGLLIFDIFNPSLEALVSAPGTEQPVDDAEFTTPDGRRIVRTFQLMAQDRFNQVNRIDLIYHVTHPDGRQERLPQPICLRYLFRFEAEHLLARAGFTVEHVYGGFDKSPYGSAYPGELIFAARKT